MRNRTWLSHVMLQSDTTLSQIRSPHWCLSSSLRVYCVGFGIDVVSIVSRDLYAPNRELLTPTLNPI